MALKNPRYDSDANNPETGNCIDGTALYFSVCCDPSSNCDEQPGAFDLSAMESPQSFAEIFGREQLYQRSIDRTGFLPACPEFIQDLREASYILLLSGEIDEDVLQRILEEFKIASQYHDVSSKELYVVSGNAALREYIQGVKIFDSPGGVEPKFATKLENIKRIHDRFAILDNHIWHFGVGIGGMHKTFHALSGPWIDVNRSFRRFCQQFF